MMKANAHAMPPVLRRVREMCLDNALADLREALDGALLSECDECGAEIDLGGRDSSSDLIEAAERVLRLLEELR